MDNAEDWRVMEAERGRKMYYNIKSGCSTFEKPNVLKTMAELQRVRQLPTFCMHKRNIG